MKSKQISSGNQVFLPISRDQSGGKEAVANCQEGAPSLLCWPSESQETPYSIGGVVWRWVSAQQPSQGPDMHSGLPREEGDRWSAPKLPVSCVDKPRPSFLSPSPVSSLATCLTCANNVQVDAIKRTLGGQPVSPATLGVQSCYPHKNCLWRDRHVYVGG